MKKIKQLTVFTLSLLFCLVFGVTTAFAGNINIYYDELPGYDKSSLPYFALLSDDILIASNNELTGDSQHNIVTSSETVYSAFKYDNHKWVKQDVQISYDNTVYYYNSVAILSADDKETVLYNSSSNVNLIIGNNSYDDIVTQNDYDDTVVNRLDLIYTLLLYFFAFCIVGFVCFLLYRSVANFITF